MSKEIGITTKKSQDLSEWYTQIVTKAELADYAPIKGFMVLRPYGFALLERIRAYLDGRLKESGHTNAYFPSLIPESLLKREAEHFSGFTPEVFWVTQAGENKLSERLAVRPTSETIIYDSYSKWVRSWRDLPILINVWNSVLRAEITATKPFLRTSEFLWQEGHTVHQTKEDTDTEVMLILEYYRALIEDQLAVPVITGYKSEREKFVGALYTTTLEAMMPDGRAIQMGTSHNLGQNFSKPFEIKFLGKDGETHYAWTASWGVSWRLISAMIMLHGDDRGLVVPPRIASTQTVIVPIYYKTGETESIRQKTNAVLDLLTKAGIAATLDDREQYTPGWKFNEWELKGVPLRIEIGPRDVEKRQVTFVRRDDQTKRAVSEDVVVDETKRTLEDIQSSLLKKAKALLEGSIRTTGDYAEFKKTLNELGGFIHASWCGRSECEDSIKTETGATIRAIPLNEKDGDSKCIFCGRSPSKAVYFARSY
jgi:prolyl-tRNA synthetase